MSLDVARAWRNLGEAAAAQENPRRAAAAWTRVRDTRVALGIGRDLVDLWTALASATDAPTAGEDAEFAALRQHLALLARRAAPRPPAS